MSTHYFSIPPVHPRSAKAALLSPMWQKDLYEEERPPYEDEEDDNNDQEYEDESRHFPSFEERNPLVSNRHRGYVDYDNVEDDDPFNLFGTAAPKETLPISIGSGVDRMLGNSDDENDYEERYYGGGRRRLAEADDDRRRDSWKDSRREEGGGAGGRIDLRAKLQARRRAGNKNW